MGRSDMHSRRTVTTETIKRVYEDRRGEPLHLWEEQVDVHTEILDGETRLCQETRTRYSKYNAWDELIEHRELIDNELSYKVNYYLGEITNELECVKGLEFSRCYLYHNPVYALLVPKSQSYKIGEEFVTPELFAKRWREEIGVRPHSEAFLQDRQPLAECRLDEWVCDAQETDKTCAGAEPNAQEKDKACVQPNNPINNYEVSKD